MQAVFSGSEKVAKEHENEHENRGGCDVLEGAVVLEVRLDQYWVPLKFAIKYRHFYVFCITSALR